MTPTRTSTLQPSSAPLALFWTAAASRRPLRDIVNSSPGHARSAILRRAGVECTGSYGAALTRHLRAEGIEVTEVNQPDKAARRRHGKTDAVDAEAAARAVLSGRAPAAAKTSDGPVEMLRLSNWPRAPRSSPGPRPSTNSRASWSPQTPPCASCWPA
ncbi:transposase [Streptomyces sp. V4I8]|uniref:IS110 family transposase n=1 Tax=Streptomyces sp. V4I8 TaxID=3156469 RepID=UPI0035149390